MDKDTKLVYLLIADQDDRTLTSETVEALGQSIPIRYFARPAALLAALEETAPSLILIDEHTAPEPGTQVLKELKGNVAFRSIPVVVLTDSPRWSDHQRCYDLGASTVIRKPHTSQQTTDKIRIFFDYWTQVAETRPAE